MTENTLVRREFCTQAAIALRRLILQDPPQASATLWGELLALCQKADWQEPRFALPLAQALPALLAHPEALDGLKKTLTDKVLADAPIPWLKAVTAAVAEKQNQKDLDESSQTALADFLRAATLERQPELAPKPGAEN